MEEFEKLILGINSPKKQIKGPYLIVHKNFAKKWAIVAIDWEGIPHLGIRWFHGKKGVPISSSHPIWFIIPDELNSSILNGLNLEKRILLLINQFLSGSLSGKKLTKSI